MIRVPGVNDQRQSRFLRRPRYVGEDDFLIFARRMIVVEVEAAFANADDIVLARQVDEKVRRQIGVINRIVRVRAD